MSFPLKASVQSNKSLVESGLKDRATVQAITLSVLSVISTLRPSI